MSTRLQRRLDLADEAELVAPLSGPSYGPFNIAKRRWHKRLPAIIADATANSRAVVVRLERGAYMPDLENAAYYQDIFNTLLERSRQQLRALEAFAAIDWRE